MRKNILVALIAASTLFVGCDSANDSGAIQVHFRVADGSQSLAKTAAGTLEIAGSNGTLRLTGVHLIVAEFELDRLNDDDCDLLTDAQDDDNCEEFEAPPFFVDLPLDETTVTVASANITPDTYKELDFEIENLEDDEDSAVQTAALLAQIRTDFPAWPAKASMAFVGEFETPGPGGEVRPFTVYADAEIEIEMAFDPPITIDTANEDQITIVVDPSEWLKDADGSVVDLSTFDYGSSGELIEFEVEIENGFKEIEFED
jgi:hypothetical protein